MGGVSRRCPPCLAGSEMTRSFRLSLYLLIGLLLGFSATFAFAATVALKLPANVASVGGGYVTAGSSAFNGLSFNSGMTTQVGGKAVTVPASWRLAANAGQYAANLVRLTPAGLITTAVAAWLLSEGIEYLNGQFMKQPEPSGNGFCQGINGADACTSAQAEALVNQIYPNQAPFVFDYYTPTSACFKSTNANWSNFKPCFGNSKSLPAASPIPAAESDFVPLATKPLPDAVASDLSAKGKPLPLQNPQVSPTPQTIRLSDPYVDPVTKKRFIDQATLTPQPTTPEVVKVEITKQEVDAAGSPIVDSVTSEPTPPEEQSDFCVKNPDVLACAQLGEPEDVDLQKITAGTAITPVSIGGVGSCPAAKSVNYMGANLQVSFTPICTAAGWINPIVLALAWLSAGFILIGAFKQG